MNRPVLWSFRRCPYAMRARLAIASAGVSTTLREVVLRDKPDAFLATSPSATVPCLDTDDQVIDESFDIMIWALAQNDPEGWLDMPDAGHALISACDGPFKTALDQYKYPTRYDSIDPQVARSSAATFLQGLNTQLDGQEYLFGDTPKLADMAVLPFIRQFAHVDLYWFTEQPWSALSGWLGNFKSSARFAAIMPKYVQWQPGDAPVIFPEVNTQRQKGPANEGGA